MDSLKFEHLYNVSEIVSVCFFSLLTISLVSFLRENCHQTKQMIVFYHNERKKDRKIFYSLEQGGIWLDESIFNCGENNIIIWNELFSH